MEKGKRPLTLDEMSAVSGGLVVDDGNGQFWIIKQDGTVIAPAPDQESACWFAKAYNTSPEVITLEEYEKRFGRELVW